jgi:hypothetical protein
MKTTCNTITIELYTAMYKQAVKLADQIYGKESAFGRGTEEWERCVEMHIQRMMYLEVNLSTTALGPEL